MYQSLYIDTNDALGINAEAEWALMDAVTEEDVTPALEYVAPVIRFEGPVVYA